MDTITTVPQNAGNIGGIALTPPTPGFDYNNTIPAGPRHGAGEMKVSPEVQFDSKIVRAVKRWAAHEDVEIKFYAAKGLGNVRVRIINHDAGGKTCDMSLATFMGSSPTVM
jgi:hypothetical protein